MTYDNGCMACKNTSLASYIPVACEDGPLIGAFIEEETKIMGGENEE